MPSPDLFGILDVVKGLMPPAGLEPAHVDGFSWARNGLSYGASTKLTADDWNRIIANLRMVLVSSGVDLATLDPASPSLLRDVIVNYIVAKLGDVLPGYIEGNASTIAGDIVADPVFAGVLASALGALTFTFATATADADPGNGKFRLNNASPASATAIYLDNLDAYGGAVAAAIDTWDDSTSPMRGTLTLGPVGNPLVRYTYNVTGSVVDGTGYRKLTLTFVAGSGAIPAGAACWLVFNRSGDKGDFAGPAAAAADNIVTFADATGKAGKNSGVAIGSLAPKANAVFTGSFTPPDGAIAPTKLDNGAAASVLGRSANSIGSRADIPAGIDDTILRRVAGALGFGQMTAGMVPAGLLTYAMLSSGAIASNAEFQLGTASKLLTAASLKSTVAYQALTDAATIAWDMSLGNNALVVLAGNRTLGNPSNASPQFGFVLKVTSTTSTRTLDKGTNWVIAAGVETFPINVAITETVFILGFVDTSSRIVVTGVVRT